MQRLRTQKGLSLIEVTIMLLVLMLLTGVLAPSIFDFVNDAKWVKVKEDCEAIGLSIARLARDVGPCLQKTYAAAGCTRANRADVLTSDGTAPTLAASISTDNFSNSNVDVAVVWTTSEDTLDDQLVTNAAAYPNPTFFVVGNEFGVGPHFNLGWRGAYISAPIGPDPWGKAYLVNSGFLSPAYHEAIGGAGNLDAGQDGAYRWTKDTFCLSAGPNGQISTPIGGSANGGTTRGGDDFVYIISGGSR